jgi:predicted ABC-type ATPase
MYVNFFKKFKLQGYKLHLFFLWVPNSELAIARIKERVLEGGHDIPVVDVRRRFTRSISNLFKLYQPMVDLWMLFNNSGTIPILIAKGRNGQSSIIDEGLFEQIKKMGNKT